MTPMLLEAVPSPLGRRGLSDPKKDMQPSMKVMGLIPERSPLFSASSILFLQYHPAAVLCCAVSPFDY